jgi:hypothetical protein
VREGRGMGHALSELRLVVLQIGEELAHVEEDVHGINSVS